MAVRKNREYRNFPLRLEVRAGEADETFRVTGYAATYKGQDVGGLGKPEVKGFLGGGSGPRQGHSRLGEHQEQDL